jgi:hypothetical protein
VTKIKERVSIRPNPGWFKKGHDPRRHKLTLKEKRQGGWTRYVQIMTDLRLAMNLPLPLPQLRAMAIQMRYAKSTFASLQQKA